ncbi:pimeloyl-ACP methyl ester carboxylesterase [Sphingomonas vulcanisoli]|uniref:Pimeloyl-ACP methyl ester carboxylesterase n=1 Tax=Sphingomonas vulcanisoli TaxID=1658060 RepID=A0ABX0TSA0_9SPHN|nr:alpha/beta hydrolase [Sphingomonas vulcanisoli]NIJ08401.1 pimeloyl-ACP methyl ester carboxylesterase [Sphingomonas vulcanisoli]
MTIVGVSRTWASADGLTLHAYEYAAADGPEKLPVICVHGLTRNGRDFDALAPWIAARGRRVLAVDVRGRGLSDRDPQARYHLPVYTADLRAMMAALRIARAHFVGTSMGGLIVMELAGEAPELIASAVINDVGPELSPVGLARIGTYVGGAPVFGSWDEAETYLCRLNGDALPHYGAEDWARMARRLFREQEGGISADYDRAIAGAFATSPTPSDPWMLWDKLADGRPILLLRGALSDLLTEEAAQRMLRPGVRYTIVPGVGHAPMLDEPVALAAIGDHLADLP